MTTTTEQKQETVAIRATVCPSCGKLLYPAPLVCRCGCVLPRDEDSGRGVDVEGPCRLLSWTRLKAVPEGFDETEMTLGMVEFDSGVRAVGQLEAENPHSGMELVAEVRECCAGEYRHGLRHVMREATCANS